MVIFIYYLSLFFVATCFLLFMAFGYSIIPLSYAMSLLKSFSQSGVFNLLLLIHVIGFTVLYILAIISKIKGSLFGLSDYAIRGLFSTFPTFAFINGLLKVYTTGSSHNFCKQIDCSIDAHLILNLTGFFDTCCPPKEFEATYFDWSADNGVFSEITIMFAVGTLVMALIIIYESNLAFYWYGIKNMLKKPQLIPPISTADESEDEDVVREKEYVSRLIKNEDFNQEVLLAHELTKKYKNILAVNNLSFSLHHKECFGLLGVNGAGKSTTFAMLTGDTIITHGNAYIKRHDIKTQRSQYLSDISYCPQFNAFLENLTTVETLYLFARLRGKSLLTLRFSLTKIYSNCNLIYLGIPEKFIAENVDHLIKMLGLQNGAKYRAGVLSGGTKRKLSLAIALIGSPSVILLDEPTTGVDASSRRKVWSVLQQYQKNNSCSIILCSHSMEECEALCSRVGIMVKGEFRCLGKFSDNVNLL